MRSLIFGYGVTGQSFDRYLRKNGIRFDIYDVMDIDHPNAFSKLPSKEKLQSYEMVYLSPGINIRKLYPNKEFEKVSFKTDIDIFFAEDKSIKIGITGTNGKSTCCMHLSQLLNNSEILGNFGRPLLDSINSQKKYSIIELSSFQLEKMKDNFLDFGILLNLSPDHIDHHGSFDNYIKAKNRILESNQSTTQNSPFAIFEVITGKKYQGNLQLEDLINLPHRLEKIRLNNRVIVINDSKSTNSDSLKYALENISDDSCAHLIVMGDSSKERYDSLMLSRPQNLYICGKHGDDLCDKIVHPNKFIFPSLKETLKHINSFSGNLEILFSPGNPSGQDYKNFEARGEHFLALANEILND
tara:strand:- start:2260 stop:3327 length:1068 start_codon:yes stop_codon:yes gene_type:complete